MATISDGPRCGSDRHGPRRTVRVVPGYVFRNAVKLRSHNLVDIQKKSTNFTFRGKGWGHGVGMCQWGAIEMGKKGATETEILRHYYPGIEFNKVY